MIKVFIYIVYYTINLVFNKNIFQYLGVIEFLSNLKPLVKLFLKDYNNLMSII